MEYNFREIEKKWQKRWVENKTYQVTEDETKTRRSSAGIHCFGYLRPLQTTARFQCTESHGI